MRDQFGEIGKIDQRRRGGGIAGGRLRRKRLGQGRNSGRALTDGSGLAMHLDEDQTGQGHGGKSDGDTGKSFHDVCGNDGCGFKLPGISPKRCLSRRSGFDKSCGSKFRGIGQVGDSCVRRFQTHVIGCAATKRTHTLGFGCGHCLQSGDFAPTGCRLRAK